MRREPPQPPPLAPSPPAEVFDSVLQSLQHLSTLSSAFTIIFRKGHPASARPSVSGALHCSHPDQANQKPDPRLIGQIVIG